MALCVRQKDAWAQAMIYFDKALKLDPNNVNLLFMAGETVGLLEEYDQALPYFKKAIELDPNNAMFHAS